MSRLLASLRPHARLAFSLGGLFSGSSPLTTSTISAATREPTKTKYVLRTPPSDPALQREVPTPLVFVSAAAWDAESAKGMESFASMFAQRGYTCLEIDIAKPEESPQDSRALLNHFEQELRSHIRLASIPFAPVVVARAGGTLIAQSFVESNPASGLVLLSPPSSNAAVAPTSRPLEQAVEEEKNLDHSPTLLPTPLPEFTYEPLFPIAVLAPRTELERLRRAHRLFRPAPEDKPTPSAPPRHHHRPLGMFGGGGRGRWEVDSFEVEDLEGQEAFVRIERWLDDVGV